MKNILRMAMLLFPLLGLLGSCSSDDDIVFDHEKAAFEIQADKVLLEVIPPSTTAADEDVYIVGAFNGQDDESVIGKDQWKLTPSEVISQKRGIYLDPTTFVEGKTLADGYHFVSSKQRNEVTALGGEVNRTESYAVGTRTNIYITNWAAYFDKAPTEPTHDGYVVYVDNQTSWGNALALYMWGDAELAGGWPGMQPTGTQVKDGVTYTYFDLGEANSGLTENLIFNNNGGGIQLSDFNFTITRDLYLRITDAGVEEITNEPKHDGFAVFVDNQTSWDALSLYMWGDINDLNGAWPGMEPTGTQVVNGITYTYFDFGEANTGKNENLIFNNTNGVQLPDFNFTIDHHVYLRITDSGVTEIDPNGGEESEAKLSPYIAPIR